MTSAAPQALSAKYKFDASGNPTHDKDGNALEGKAMDKALKDIEKEKKVRAPLAKKMEEEGPDVLERMHREVAELEAELQQLSV